MIMRCILLSLRIKGYLNIEHISLLVNVFFVDNNTVSFSSFLTFATCILGFSLLTVSTQLSLLFILPVYLGVERLFVYKLLEKS